MSMKNPMTPAGIEPATFRFVAQHLNHVLPQSPLTAYSTVQNSRYVHNQLDAQNFCFTISLFHTSTGFEHMCLSSGGQYCITQPLVSSHL